MLPAQLATKPLAEDVEVGTELVIGPNAKKPLRLRIPIFVSDMSFGSLSQEARAALATVAELAGTGISSGEGEYEGGHPRQIRNRGRLCDYRG